MPKHAKSLNLREIKKITKVGIWAIGHVKGLSIRVNDSGGVSYVYRYRLDSQTRSVTIGDINTFTLKEAITQCTMYRLMLLEGKDPYLEKKKKRKKLMEEVNENKKLRSTTESSAFSMIANKFLDYRKESGAFLNNDRAEKTYSSMLINHAYPVIKNKPIGTVTPTDIRDILAKVWRKKPSLSRKLLNLLRQIFEWALDMLYYEGINPARMAGTLKTLMEPFKTGRTEEGHYASLDYHQIPDFMKALWEIGTIGAKGLMFSILTASRSKPVRFMTWDQVDLKLKIWEIPIQNDKSKKSARLRSIMLSPQAVLLLQSMPRRDNLVFFSTRLTPFSDAVFGKVIKDLNASLIEKHEKPYVDNNILDDEGNPTPITQHGTARATFKTWAKSDELGNNRKFFDEAVELCLLHERKDPLRGAYDRSKLEKERRKIMDEWGKFCCSKIKELNTK